MMRRPAAFAALVTLAACGAEPSFAPATQESRQTWEGIGIWGTAADTASLASVGGVTVASPRKSLRTGDLIWTVESIEKIERGVARTWTSVNERWVAVRLALARDTPTAPDSVTPPPPLERREVLLRENVVLIDDHGGRHVPLMVHDRLYPLVDRPIAVDTSVLVLPLLFAVPHATEPAAVEIHYPLGSGKIEWIAPREPDDWIQINRKTILQDRSMRALWEVALRRVRFTTEPVSPAFEAEISIRNVTRSPAPAPDPASIRLYAGSGRTWASASTSSVVMVEPGRSEVMKIAFRDVPRRESLDLVVPYGADYLRMDAHPGMMPEAPVPMKTPVQSGGLRATPYTAGAGEASSFRVRMGLLVLSDSAMPTAGMIIEGMPVGGTSWIPGLAEFAPAVLHSSFEERFWVRFPVTVAVVRISLHGRSLVIPL